MKIKVFILFMLSLIFVSCIKKERVLECEEDFLNNKIYMKIKSGKKIKIIISNADLNFLCSGFDNLTEKNVSEYVELNAKYSSKDNEIIIHNSKIRLPVLFYNEQGCTILSEKGAVIEFYENNNNLEIPKNTKYTVKSSEERIAYLVSLIENNLENSSVCLAFQEEQKAWELYKQKTFRIAFPGFN